ncbi:MAG TPA: hypothetical protein VFU46_09700 [Gemmatimonadales bacterium]|nr:hypothetical protein [Gemmatimonadales bacterium]
MRPLTLAGLVLVALGLFVALSGLRYRGERSVLRFGEFQASIEEERTVPPWTGGVAVVAGVALILADRRRR